MIELFKHIIHLDFDWIISNYNNTVYTILFLVIFIETGLVLMPFLPGDSLLFTAGLFAGRGTLDVSMILILLSVAAILGDNSNYWIGRKIGLKFLELKIRGRRLIKATYLEKTEQFFEKNGTKAIIMARFVPIVRTFTPFAAGVGKMKYKTFLIFDIAGGILWIFSMTLLGYFLGEIDWVGKNIDKVCIGIIFLSVLPMILSYIKSKRIKVEECVDMD